MNASALVRSPLKTSGSSPIGFASWAWGTGHKLGGRFGPVGIGSPPSGGTPDGPFPPPSLPPPSGGPLPPPCGLHSGGGASSPSSVRRKALLKLVASLVSTSEVVWVTMVGGSYLWE